jgi:hypothetical protein
VLQIKARIGLAAQKCGVLTKEAYDAFLAACQPLLSMNQEYSWEADSALLHMLQLAPRRGDVLVTEQILVAATRWLQDGAMKLDNAAQFMHVRCSLACGYLAKRQSRGDSGCTTPCVMGST